MLIGFGEEVYKQEPFPYRIWEGNFLPNDLYKELKQLVYEFEPTKETLLNANEDVYPYGQTHLCPNLNGFRDLWIMPEHKNWLADKISWPKNITPIIDVSMHIDSEGFYQKAHRDLKPTQSPAGYGTLQIYFGNEEDETTGAWVLDDEHNKIEQVPYAENTAWAFLATRNSWHSVDTINKPINRRSIMINVRGDLSNRSTTKTTNFNFVKHNPRKWKSFRDHTRVDFCITTYCQSKCPTCPRTNAETLELAEFITLQHMPYSVWYGVMDKVDWSRKEIQFSGEHGDPMMHPDIEKFILSSAERAWLTTVNTNGALRNKKWYEEIYDKVEDCDYGELSFVFAIDGLTQETNEKYRIDVNFKKAWENFMTVAENHSRLTYWDFLVFEHNWHELEEVIRIARDLEVNLDIKVNRGDYQCLKSNEGKQHVKNILGIDVDAEGQQIGKLQ